MLRPWAGACACVGVRYGRSLVRPRGGAFLPPGCHEATAAALRPPLRPAAAVPTSASARAAGRPGPLLPPPGWSSRCAWGPGSSRGKGGRGGRKRGANKSNHGAQHLYNTPPLTRVGKCLLARVMEGFTPQPSPKRAVCVAAREEGKGVHARSFERLRSRGVNPCAAHLAEPALRQGLEVREAGELAPPRALVAANLGK